MFEVMRLDFIEMAPLWLSSRSDKISAISIIYRLTVTVKINHQNMGQRTKDANRVSKCKLSFRVQTKVSNYGLRIKIQTEYYRCKRIISAQTIYVGQSQENI